MIKINELKDNVLDLNDYNNGTIDLNVVSENSFGFRSSWYFDLISMDDDVFSVYSIGNDKIEISVDLDKFKSNEFFTLRNSNNDWIKIDIIPNKKRSAKKRYSFKIAKARNVLNGIQIDTDTKDGYFAVISFEIDSKVNGEFAPYLVDDDCNGYPLEYDIDLPSNNNSKICVLRLKNKLVNNYTSTIVLRQERSNKTLKIDIIYDKDNKDKPFTVNIT